jgi:hypothetical protein
VTNMSKMNWARAGQRTRIAQWGAISIRDEEAWHRDPSPLPISKKEKRRREREKRRRQREARLEELRAEAAKAGQVGWDRTRSNPSKASGVSPSSIGDPCPRCGREMAVCEHDRITDKQLRQPFYYSRWFRCLRGDCRTTLVMPERFKVWNGEQGRRLEAIKEQLTPRA